ncbi:xyloglucan galactosyltransferase XLT2 [Arachis stenosperma]|uniref:xyloglucan galactosyltransferase XLT2 n=1 Tax=Arachis stenosperma TaxID=217475 RepID=UPI0025AB7C28|nr:xyloglucan galactosyltransferase XLT2 [Arachis stenosperma]
MYPLSLLLSLNSLHTRLPNSTYKPSATNNSFLMLPHSSEPHRRPKSPELSDPKSTFSALTAALIHLLSPRNPRSWILYIILFLQILLLSNLRSFPYPDAFLHPSTLLHNSTNAHHPYLSIPANAVVQQPTLPQSEVIENTSLDQCGSGRVFVYDLPRTFNKEILENCDNLNPWSSRCVALANDGLGQSAAGLAGIVPEDLLPAWYWTDQFVSEIIFHRRMLHHKCRVTEPELATAFYIPFYAGLAVGKYLWSNTSTAKDRDHHCDMMLTWLNDQPYYKKSNGWNHFITMGRITWDFRRSKDQDWGSSCIYKTGMRNVTRLLIERNPWDYFDVGVPYPTGFHPRFDSDVTRWQQFVRDRRRSSLFCFAGAPRRTFRNDFRGLLLSQCRDSGESCRAVNCSGSRCSNGTSAIMEAFLESDFCLQPRGDSFTRRSIFDCMVAGSIPVFFWRRSAYFQYEWFLPAEPGSYSVYIDRNAVKNGTSVKAVLESYSKEEVRKMREKVIEYIPRLVYAKSNNGLEGMKDAFDVAMEGVFRRFRDQEDLSFSKWR